MDRLQTQGDARRSRVWRTERGRKREKEGGGRNGETHAWGCGRDGRQKEKHRAGGETEADWERRQDGKCQC